MTQKNFGCLGVFLVVVLALSVLLNLIFIIAGSASASASLGVPQAPKFRESVVLEAVPGKDAGQPDAKIALIYLRGIITSAASGDIGETMVDDLKLQLRQATE
ncbi:MAG TPA: hypothetical protein VGO90_12305, partial [Chthoniobacteraceae bacterium]|nr:hypothetical protein [Chthoniobacteraceae bacterium]